MKKGNEQLFSLISEIQSKYPHLANVYIPPELSRSIYALFYILEDIRLAKEGAKKLLSLIDQAEKDQDFSERGVFEVLSYGIVSTYGRCFTENKGRHSKLESAIFDDDAEIKAIHEQIMETRNTFVAHRDDTYRFAAAVVLVIPDDDPAQNRFIIEMQRKVIDRADLDSYMVLFEHVGLKAEAILEKKRKKLAVTLEKLGVEHMLKYNVQITLADLLTGGQQQ